MEMLFDHFPVFEANQVLTSGHLNDVFDYLDQQTRQSRTHLIGIGIVCGLNVTLDNNAGPAVLLAKGCGVTSEGYLIVEPEDLTLVAYRPYTLPPDIEYPPFKNGGGQYPLFELFTAGEPNTTALGATPGFLDDKAVLLFLELNKQPLRNCSPNNCDDKGSQVTATVRPLLIASGDLDKIIAAANALGSGLTSDDIDQALSARLNLADLALPRFDVPNTNPATSNDVYAGFLGVFHVAGLAQATATALSAAYTAFKPLLAKQYPSDPFANFGAAFGFLDGAPANTAQVRFLQYYTDLFDDLLRAYNEFRWKGAEFLCACCPPDDMFPRHLMAGLLHPENAADPGRYRQTFLASPALDDCTAETEELLQLFARLVEMTARFTNAPALPAANDQAAVDPQIRITPTTYGPAPLDTKAIPYYYAQNGTPPLYRLWSFEKTQRKRANQNLSYNADQYSPIAPAFVTDALRYDIERYDFLRIEGHLGKDYQRALGTLLTLKSQYRLPIDVIALRTGAYDDSQPVDLTNEQARFQDLDVLYQALRGELLASLAEGAIELYDLAVAGFTAAAGTPQLPLLKAEAANYRFPANSVGAFYEQNLNRFENQSYIDVDQNNIDANAVALVYCQLFTGLSLPPENYPHVVAIYYISKLANILPPTLDALAFADFQNKYQDLIGLLRFFRSDAISKITPDLKNFLPQEEMIELCEEILFGCQLDALTAVHDEYANRIGELKKRQFLSNFLAQHPGIQHKAGVPIGGTFILVYHDEPQSTGSLNLGLFQESTLFQAVDVQPMQMEMRVAQRTPARTAASQMPITQSAVASSGRVDFAGASNTPLRQAITRISNNRSFAQNPDIGLLIGSLTGKIPIVNIPSLNLDDPSAQIISQAVGELGDGTVIADFYLPYRISGDVPGMEFVLPKTPPTFTVDMGCTGPDGNASVAIDVKGGVPPYDVAVDQNGYQGLNGPLPLAAGTHSLKVRDAEGVESKSQSIPVPDPLTIGAAATYQCTGTNYTATISIAGGVQPYTVNGKAASGTSFTTDPVASGTPVSVAVLDNNGCTANAQFTHTCPPPCTLPCAGASVRSNYRFWLPDIDPNNPYQVFELQVLKFSVQWDEDPKKVESLKVNLALPKALTAQNFKNVVESWTSQINQAIANDPLLVQQGKAQWLTLGYESLGPDRFGVLWIEYFKCLSFDIQISFVLAMAGANRQTVTVSYAPAGTTIQIGNSPIKVGNSPIKIPATGVSETDKCNPSAPSVKLCATPPKITLHIDQEGGGSARKFAVTASPHPSDLVFLWEAQDGNPAMGNAATFATEFGNRSFATKFVTVTAYTGGCAVSQTIQVQLPPA